MEDFGKCKAERREHKRNKANQHRVHANFSDQYNAMLKRENERRERIQRHKSIRTKYDEGV